MAAETLSEGDPPDNRRIRWRGRVLVTSGIVAALAIIIWQSGRYLLLDAYIDHIEGNVAISGWQYLHGFPLYGTVDGSPQFATFYGPLAYVVEAAAMALFGAGVATSKLTSLLALSGTIAVVGWHLRKSPIARAREGMLVLVAGMLLFSPASFWARPDSLEALLVAIGLACAGRTWGATAVGICIGLATNLKIHAFFYFLPIVFDLWSRGGWRSLARTATTSGLVFLLPFLAPGISLHDYMTALATQVGRRLVDSHSFHPFAGMTNFIVAPAVLVVSALLGAALGTPPQERRHFCAILATLLLLLYPATFPGAGAYHILPFVPVLADAFARLRSQDVATRYAPLALLLSGALSALILVGRMEKAVSGSNVIAAEALAIAEREPSRTVQIGYGDSPRSYVASQLSKAVLAFNGHPAVVDAQVLMDLKYIGIDGSARWTRDVVSCRFQYWLLPKDEQPFAIGSYYGDGLVFDEQFRAAFFDHYERIASTDHLDIWACSPAIDRGGHKLG